MSLLAPPRPLRLAPVVVPAEPAARRPLLRPGWPLTAALAGFPIWWVLGISSFIGHLAAVLMVLELARRRRIPVPRGIAVWLLFLLWVLAGVLVLQVTAPHAVPSTSTGRYISWAYRLGWYVSATVALVYIGAMRDVLSTTRIARAAAALFLTIVAGGWLGILWPQLTFPSLLEVALPQGVTRIEFVEFLVHPEVAQNYPGAAASHPRPSAPFSYANIWGLNFACFLPFFLLAWRGRTAGWRRPLSLPLLGVALVPAVLSLNRGMWLALLAMTALVAVRSALLGRFRILFAVGALAVALAAVLALSPLGAMVESRFENPVSNQGRASLASLTVTSALEGSPVVGFGSTRDVQGAFFSIAGGSSTRCPLCTPPALGTQGQVWLVLFSQGLVGLAFYLGFLLLWLVRGLRVPTAAAMTGTAVILAQIVTLPFYDSIGISTVAALIAVGFVWVEGERRREALTGRPVSPDDEYTLGGYVGLVRRHAALLVVATVLGAAAGAGAQLWRGPESIGLVSLSLPKESKLADVGREATLDTLAQLARDEQVTSAMSRAAGQPVEQDDLYVSADPNSRILNLRYAGSDEGGARAAVAAAGDTLLRLRLALLQAERDDAVREFDARYVALLQSISTVDESMLALGATPGQSPPGSPVRLLEEQRQELLVQAGRAAGRGTRAAAMPIDAGQVVRPATSWPSNDRLVVLTVSGGLLGLLVGLAAARARGLTGPRLHRVRHLGLVADLPQLARLPSDPVNERGSVRAEAEPAWVGVLHGLRLHAPLTVQCIAKEPGPHRVAAALDAEVQQGQRAQRDVVHLGPDNRVAFVVSSTTRLGTLHRRAAAARRAGLDVIGVVVVRHRRTTALGARLRRHLPAIRSITHPERRT